MDPFLKILLFSMIGSTTVQALRCYTGYALVRGQTVGTTIENCTESDAYCYRASADINIFAAGKKAGCSKWRCMMNHNKCIKHQVTAADLEFCCCNDRDLCNDSSVTKPPLLITFLSWIALLSIFCRVNL